MSPLVPGHAIAGLWLRNAALGTSGAGEQFLIADGRRYGHVIDPRTGWPATGVVSASVVASDAARADALSTAFLVGGIELAGAVLCRALRRARAHHARRRVGRPIVIGATRACDSSRPDRQRYTSCPPCISRASADHARSPAHAGRLALPVRGLHEAAPPGLGTERRACRAVVVVGYLKAATGPLATIFHWIGNAPWIGSIDLLVAVALTAAGVSLMLGLFTQTGCAGALALLTMFYLAAIPTGRLDARAEGTYLLVNKTLIEACAVAVVFACRTGSIAGFDRLWRPSPTARRA